MYIFAFQNVEAQPAYQAQHFDFFFFEEEGGTPSSYTHKRILCYVRHALRGDGGAPRERERERREGRGGEEEGTEGERRRRCRRRRRRKVYSELTQ